MGADCTLRPAVTDDVEQILFVHVAAIIDRGPSAYSDRQVAAWAAKTEGTDRYVIAIEEPTIDLVVATVDDRVIGFGQPDRDVGEIEALFVDPEWMGRGIGSNLLQELEQRIIADGFDVVRLRAVRNATEFYEERGYERVETVENQTTAGISVRSVRMENDVRSHSSDFVNTRQ